MPTCEFCHVEFESPRELTYHMIRCVERPDDARYKCRICGNKYLTEADLKDHLEDCAEEQSTTTHDCSACGEEFNAVQDLIEHKRTCSGTEAATTPSEPTVGDVVERDITGVVTHFNAEKGYGFITTYDLEAYQPADEPNEDVYFDVSAYPGDEPGDGERLRFDAKQTDEGYEAVDVSVADRQGAAARDSRFASDRVQWGRDT
jgi:cold shock CspA family protein